MIVATEETLTVMTYNKEPSTEGTWYLVDLEDLRAQGVRYVEIHFPDRADDDEPTDPNMVRFLDGEGE
jgi:hypothetical protein